MNFLQKFLLLDEIDMSERMLADKQMNGKHAVSDSNYINSVATDGKEFEESVAKGVFVKNMTARWTTVSK